jgi:uncharacterized membrane protein
MSDRRAASPVLVRALIGVVLGAATTVALLPIIGATAGLLSGWAAFALLQVIWTLLVVWPMDAAATRSHARREDPGRSTARIVALVGSVASLGAVVLVLIQSEQTPRIMEVVLAGVAFLSAAASWLLIQVDFLLRLAAEYYADPVGGIDFNQDEAPMYTDFAYVSFALGITYGVTDTNIRTSAIRRMATGQALLSYLFGAVILATVISLVTGL